MNQLSLFDYAMLGNTQVESLDTSLDLAVFDKRRRSYETDVAYALRLEMLAQAFRTDYYTSKWVSITTWVDICPKGPDNRLPKDRARLGDCDCFFLTIRDIVPEDWQVPAQLTRQPGNVLPARATYVARTGDVLLSRFKEPLGKCVIYPGKPAPLYVSSNFILLRPKSEIDPILLLAVLKSSFLACQLHYVIRRRSLITEMFVNEVPQLAMPDLPADARDSLVVWGRRMLAALAKQKPVVAPDKLWDARQRIGDSLEEMSEATNAIDIIIKDFTGT